MKLPPEDSEEEELVPYIVYPVDGHSYKIFPNDPKTSVKFVTSNGIFIAHGVYFNSNSTKIRVLNSNYDCIFDLFNYETYGTRSSDYFEIYPIKDTLKEDLNLNQKLNSNSLIHFKKTVKAHVPDLYTAKSFILDNEKFYILLNCKCSDELTYKERFFDYFTSILDIVLYDKPRVIVAILVILILMFSMFAQF